MQRRSVELLLALLLAGALPAKPAECTCPIIMERDGWCEVHAIGYVAGLEIESHLLFEALDAHGHRIDPAAFACPTCRHAIAEDGYCEEHGLGFVSGLAYFSRLTFLVAEARASDDTGPVCPECREIAADGGWCDACGGAGFVGSVVFRDPSRFEEASHALDLVQRAERVAARCEHCAVAMVKDSICPVCKIEYRDGKAHPFRPRAPAGGSSADPPPERP